MGGHGGFTGPIFIAIISQRSEICAAVRPVV